MTNLEKRMAKLYLEIQDICWGGLDCDKCVFSVDDCEAQDCPIGVMRAKEANKILEKSGK